MKSTIATAIVLVILSSPVAAGVWGLPDVEPAASLVVPFFETGVNVSTHPHDTLLAIYCRAGSRTVHWEFYDRDGNATSNLYGNFTIGGGETWSRSVRDLINDRATSGDRSNLTVGAYYQGFITFDVVTADTAGTPFDVGYPWGTANVLLGYTYYTRLAEGSSNGIPMIHLEYTAPGTSIYQEGFYSLGSNPSYREEIDADARYCVGRLSTGNACVPDPDDKVDTIRSRAFTSSALNGSSRVVIFTWNTYRPDEGGPSAICQANPGLGCAQSYTYHRYDESGTRVVDTTMRLDHVVNVVSISGGGSGEQIWHNIPNANGATQIFALSFNTAKPPGAGQNWDAIFLSNIDVE